MLYRELRAGKARIVLDFAAWVHTMRYDRVRAGKGRVPGAEGVRNDEAVSWVHRALPLAVRAALPARLPVARIVSNPQAALSRASDDGKTYAFVVSKGDLQASRREPTTAASRSRSGSWMNPDAVGRLNGQRDRLIICVHERKNSVACGVASRDVAVDRDARISHGGNAGTVRPDRFRFTPGKRRPSDPCGPARLDQYQSPRGGPRRQSLASIMKVKRVQRAEHGSRKGCTARHTESWEGDENYRSKSGPHRSAEDFELVSHPKFDEDGPEFVGFTRTGADLRAADARRPRGHSIATGDAQPWRTSFSSRWCRRLETDRARTRRSASVSSWDRRTSISRRRSAPRYAGCEIFRFRIPENGFYRAVAPGRGPRQIIEVSSEIQADGTILRPRPARSSHEKRPDPILEILLPPSA